MGRGSRREKKMQRKKKKVAERGSHRSEKKVVLERKYAPRKEEEKQKSSEVTNTHDGPEAHARIKVKRHFRPCVSPRTHLLFNTFPPREPIIPRSN